MRFQNIWWGKRFSIIFWDGGRTRFMLLLKFICGLDGDISSLWCRDAPKQITWFNYMDHKKAWHTLCKNIQIFNKATYNFLLLLRYLTTFPCKLIFLSFPLQLFPLPQHLFYSPCTQGCLHHSTTSCWFHRLKNQ